MKNVAVLIQSEKSTPNETFIKNHIKHLPFNVTVLYSGFIPHKTEGFKEGKLKKLFYRFYDALVKKSDFEYNSFQKSQFKKILKKKRIDFVIAEYLTVGCYVSELCAELKIPMLCTALGYDISRRDVMEKNKDRYKKMFEYSKAIVVVSEHMKYNLEKYGCDLNKVVYSPIGPEESFFQVTPSFNKKQFFALGRMVDKKAPHLTILAFHKVLKKHPDANLVIGGDGPLLRVCEDLLSVLEIKNNVQLVGFINQDEQKEYLKGSMAFVQHSREAENGDNEGTPVAILEACAAGIPVVSTLHAGIPNVVLDKKTGLLSEENQVNQMVESMTSILDDIENSKRMGKAGREYVQTNFTLEKHLETLAGIINN